MEITVNAPSVDVDAAGDGPGHVNGGDGPGHVNGGEAVISPPVVLGFPDQTGGDACTTTVSPDENKESTITSSDASVAVVANSVSSELQEAAPDPAVVEVPSPTRDSISPLSSLSPSPNSSSSRGDSTFRYVGMEGSKAVVRFGSERIRLSPDLITTAVDGLVKLRDSKTLSVKLLRDCVTV